MKYNKRKKIFSNPFIPALLLIAGIILIYALLAYPFYTRMKIRIIEAAYREIGEVDLSAIDEEDEEILQDYQDENLEITITDSSYRLIYTNRSGDAGERIEKYIIAHEEEYQEQPTIHVRTNEDLKVLRLRGLVQQSGENYYIYIRKEIRLVGEMIRYTALYLIIMAAAASCLWYFGIARRYRQGLLLKKNSSPDNGLEQQGRLAQAQKEFVANISHELKTPLAVISGQIEMLQYMGDSIDRDYYFTSIREEIDKMSDMVGNLLDITIMEHHMEKMEMSEVNLTDMMEYMNLKYEALFRKNRIKVQTKVDENCIVSGNRMYLEQAVNNYIMNAFQHTAQGKKIGIYLAREAESAKISVYNDGLAVQVQDEKSIWQSFYMNAENASHEERQKNKNAGLGLYIVKNIVEQHHGSCGVENKENGVEFWMRIPLDVSGHGNARGRA